MKNVRRRDTPLSISRNAVRWRRELDAQMREHGRLGVPRQFFDNRYKKDDIRQALEVMYNNRCCYCEADIDPVAFKNIEHRAPINLFPEQALEWDNLHLACPQCNGAKSDKWNDNAPILDAVHDVPIDSHITYKAKTAIGGVKRWPITASGETTIKHADLNRGGLPQARAAVLSEILDRFREIREEIETNGMTPNVRAVVDELYILTEEEYGSLVKWAIDSWLDIRVRR